jgi:hypothetical protein
LRPPSAVVSPTDWPVERGDPAVDSPGTDSIEDFDNLPAYLHGPARSAIRPPVQTRVQELPFGELAWEDFERLCLRLAWLEADVVYCQLYGTRGQKQEGIDLYATTRASQKYRVYQCKRQEDFDAAKINAAVAKFLGGKWVGRTETLVLCTKEPLVETKRADAVVAQRAVLARRGVGFESWDSHRLNTKLKDHPRLVDDFFGRVWVEAFCGAEAAQSLGGRLDSRAIADFRCKLGAFYTRVFEKHDPGLPIAPPGGSSLDLRGRYVLPDVYEPRSVYEHRSDGSVPDGSGEQRNRGEEGQGRPQGGTKELQQEVHLQRRPADAWLSSGDNALLLAGPGGGKSSLLRFVALDLLDEWPRLGTLAEKWGRHLPVWVSFPWWTRLITRPGSEFCSLSQFLRLWLHSWDEDRLWPLVERALEDERLLLLVDGLDEWSNESAARVALDRLQVFIEGRRIPSVAVARPHGFRRLGARPSGWRVGELAGFSADQQRHLAGSWFLFRESTREGQAGEEAGLGQRRADLETEGFMSEVARSADIASLAENPLLLSLLIYHRMHHVRLPQSRFHAYESLVEHLISVHPQRRQVAANNPEATSGLSGEEIKQVLASLALRILETGGEGMIEADEAVAQVAGFLRDPDRGLGVEAVAARRQARELVEVAEASLGLIVRHSPTRIGFLHRIFLEHLAATCLARLPLGEQQKAVVRSADPLWREVVLGLLHANGRPEEIQALLDCIRTSKEMAIGTDRLSLESLLAEAAFGHFNCSPRLARQLAEEAFAVIETGPRMSHRKVLLGHAMTGLASTKVRELVKAKLRSWFPCWSCYRSGTFEAMIGWPAEPEVIECLWRAMHDEEPSNQQVAARTLARVGAKNLDQGRRVAALARLAEEQNTRAVAVDALVCGWPTLDEVGPVLDAARWADGPDVRLASIRGRVTLGSRTSDDRDELLRLGTIQSGLHHSWRREIPTLLVAGWPGDTVVKMACVEALRVPPNERRGIDADVAWLTLLTGFHLDADVVEVLRAEIAEQHPFLGVLDDFRCWDLVVRNFRGHAALGETLEGWLARTNSDPLDAARGALITMTDSAKARLLALLESGLPHWPALALLDGWGMQDPDVAAKFNEIAARPSARSAAFAHLFPRIIGDPGECRRRLLSLLHDSDCRRPDLVLEGLRTLAGPRPDTEAVDAALRCDPTRSDVFWLTRDACTLVLIQGYHDDPRIREIAKQQFSTEFPAYTVIAAAFPGDREMRGMLIDRLTPLPDYLRLVIAERLPQESPVREGSLALPAFPMELLGLYEREQDEEVKCQAALSYWNLVKATGAVSDTHLERLARDIARYGPDHEEQRQAAFCGLASLGRLDLMANAKETIGEERTCAVGTGARMARANVPMVRCILEHWEAINRTFGAETCLRLNHRHDDWTQMWGHLSPFVDGYPTARRDLLRFLESRAERTAAHNALVFLGRTMLIGDNCSSSSATIRNPQSLDPDDN